MNVAIVCYDGVDELDAIGPYRVFAGAAAAGASIGVSLVTIDATEWVTASHGLRIGVDGTLETVDPDLVVVPGGGWSARGDTGAWAEAQSGQIPAAVGRLAEEGVTVAAVCTGAMLLARAGLLEGRPAITHASAVADLREAGAEVRHERVVDAGEVITAGGVTAGIDLALHLLERSFGDDLAGAVARNLEYEPRDTPYLP